MLWEKDIIGQGRATFGDASAGVVRARIAEERAVADHIKTGLEALSQAHFDGVAVK